VKLIRGDERAEVPVERITPVDATGAGDQFAAGFLYGMATGQDLEMAGRMGVAAAAEVIRHIGPRPKRPLKDAFRRARADLTAVFARRVDRPSRPPLGAISRSLRPALPILANCYVTDSLTILVASAGRSHFGSRACVRRALRKKKESASCAPQGSAR
jgi:hypothetical protein